MVAAIAGAGVLLAVAGLATPVRDEPAPGRPRWAGYRRRLVPGDLVAGIGI